METFLSLINITKTYPGIIANDNISFDVAKGEVHALLGENGAGKSTLMNILYGLTEPDKGEFVINRNQEFIKSPKDAIKNGIGMVHQHFMLIPALTVVENIILSMDDDKKIFTNASEIAKKTIELSEKYGMRIDPYAKVCDLTVGQQQRVEIIKALYRECNLLILDEPTAVLTPQETEELFVIIKKFTGEGKSVIFITHKLNEVMKISDSITVLRNGKSIGSIKTKDTNANELAKMMVGKEVLFRAEKEEITPGEVVLEISNLKVKSINGYDAVKGLSLKVRAGEIYGIAGVDGNGQTELIKGIAALAAKSSGTVIIGNKDVSNGTPKDVLNCNVSHIPEDRQNVGVVMNMSIKENMLLHKYKEKRFKKNGLINWKSVVEYSADLMKRFNVKAASVEATISSLSGGNQQKVVVARELDKKPKLLLAVHPTRGVDIGAIEFIHKQIVSARNNGCAILLISTELEEIMSLSDQIGVIYEGNIVGEMKRENATIEKIGLLMAGKTEHINKNAV